MCLVVGQKGEQSSYTQSVPQEHVCACTLTDMYTEEPVCVCMYVPACIFAQLSGWLVSCMCGTGVSLSVCISFS